MWALAITTPLEGPVVPLVKRMPTGSLAAGSGRSVRASSAARAAHGSASQPAARSVSHAVAVSSGSPSTAKRRMLLAASGMATNRSANPASMTATAGPATRTWWARKSPR